MEQHLEHWPLERLVEYARNPRKNDHAVDKVAAAIREFGFRVPIVAKSDGTIVDGHLRFKAAKKLKLLDVPVLLADDMTEAQIKAFRISVNKVAELAEWDDELLGLELQELQEADFDLSLIGFDEDELDALLADVQSPAELNGDEDDVPDVPTQAVTALGDTWLLGRHRVRCGDSTSTTDVDALMQGKRAEMCFTDPPYGVDYDGGAFTVREKLKNDASNNIYDAVLPLLISTCSDSAAFYIWHAAGYADVADKVGKNGLKIRSQIIWNKNIAQFGALSAQYKQKHEPCFYCHKKGHAPNWYGPTNEVTVWEQDRERKNEFHPTQKPVALAERAIGNSSKPGDIVIDLFLGSGSTLIAAEKTGRTCYGMELNPAYVDVIIRRWQNATGQEATLEATGQTFDELAEAGR
jgi:DNA modification methylase